MRLESPKSICQTPGPRKKLRGTSPKPAAQAPIPGVQKAAGLKFPPAKYNGGPETRLGRCAVVFPSGPVPLVVRFTGKPVRAMKFVLSAHDPNTARAAPA